METNSNTAWLDFVTDVFKRIIEKSQNGKMANQKRKNTIQIVNDKRIENGLPAMEEKDLYNFHPIREALYRAEQDLERAIYIGKRTAEIKEKIENIKAEIIKFPYYSQVYISLEKELDTLETEYSEMQCQVETPSAPIYWQGMRFAYEKICSLLQYEYERQDMIDCTSELLKRVFQS